ncbi:hypothetical protein GKZ28_19865 [Clostridium chromiireducens]|uniref:Uncharacterized protein n=1 Tax=Clostridium chromiireducens TaxID=225345 RepID=A0A964RQ41_9CLOT|nr:hypothetical protein [Clostridium chromiireducens]MVX65939.1 hypothetical protein [Clostridium chromiireducens]
MKKLVRTVPIPKGDDSALHYDIMEFDIPMFEEKESHDYKDYVYEGGYNQRSQNSHGVLNEFNEKVNKVIPFPTPKEI